MTGTPGQIDWAEPIKLRVNEEFGRVAAAFAKVAGRQTGLEQRETFEVIALVEKHRLRVMASNSAGYFIKEWRELSGQVRKLLLDDPAYQAIQERRAARKVAVGAGV